MIAIGLTRGRSMAVYVILIASMLLVVAGDIRRPTLTPSSPPSPHHTPFVFGTASASWQYEGAQDPAATGRGPSIWEDYCGGRTPSGAPRCPGGGKDIAATATDQYDLTRLKGDIERMRSLGTRAYRLSLSWSRIFPTGRPPVNPRGVSHYRAVLGMLDAAGIEPWVTLFHFDLPSALEREEGGWLNRSMADRFAVYAELCFREFGSQVRRWITINEAHTIATAGYLYGVAAPGRCSDRSVCARGNGTTEPYIAAHNLLRAHAKAVAIFRRRQDPQANGGGGRTGQGTGSSNSFKNSSIAMVVSGDWTEPLLTPADAAAAQRRQEFQIGWFADPVFFGDYPQSMKNGVGGGRLPTFTAEERALLRGSADWFALNHYTSRYGQAVNTSACSSSSSGGGGGGDRGANISGGRGWDEDQCCNVRTAGTDGTPIGPHAAGSDWFYSVPWGMRRLLGWVGRRYPGVPIVVTENGCVDPVPGPGLPSPLNDTFRLQYLQGYLEAVRLAIVEDGVDVRGYFLWSLLDNVEWGDGLRDAFGLFRVDRASLTRTAKASVDWVSRYIRLWDAKRSSGLVELQ